MTIVLIATLIASTLYAGGSMGLKKAMNQGASSKSAVVITNACMALCAMPLLFLPFGDISSQNIALTLGAGVALFIGRLFAIQALKQGDLSLVGPLLGLKTLLIAGFATATGQLDVTPLHWISAILAFFGVTLLQKGPKSTGPKSSAAVLFAIGASVFFAATDLLVVQVRHELGVGLLTPVLFITVALMSLGLGKWQATPPDARKHLWLGSATIGFQTTLVVFLIALTGEALAINIIYASRALWTVLIDHWKGQKHPSLATTGFRFVGACCITLAVIMTSLDMYTTNQGSPTEMAPTEHQDFCHCCSGAYPL